MRLAGEAVRDPATRPRASRDRRSRPRDPRQQDRPARRLRQVVVGAGGEAVSTSSGRPRAVSISTGTNCRAARSSDDDGEAVLARQHHVEDDEIEATAAVVEQPLQRRLAGVDDLDVVALRLEVEAQAAARCCSSSTIRTVRLMRRRGRRQLQRERAALPGPALSAKHVPPCLLAPPSGR